MQIKQKKQFSKKRLLIIAVIVIALIGGLGFYVFQNSRHNQQIPANTTQTGEQNPENKVDYNPPTKEQVDETQRQKDEIIRSYENPPTSSAVSVVINRASQAGTGQPLDIRATISGATSGTCLIKLTKNSSPTIEKSFPITFEATSSSCSGASVPAADFNIAGDWNLSVTASTPVGTSAPATQTVNISK